MLVLSCVVICVCVSYTKLCRMVLHSGYQYHRLHGGAVDLLGDCCKWKQCGIHSRQDYMGNGKLLTLSAMILSYQIVFE